MQRPQASDHIATLKTEIADGLDTTLAAVRTQVKQAVESARAIAKLGVNGIAQFEAWAALKSASADDKFKSLPETINVAQRKLDEAIHWHQRQTEDSRLGVAQAKDIKQFWDDQLRPKLHKAFHVCAQFEAFAGEPRLFAWRDNVIAFPDGHKDALKKLTLLKTGVAAAAKTDGRAGDGVVTLKEWESAQSIRLFNHDVYQLAAGTLDHAPRYLWSGCLEALGRSSCRRRG